MRRRRTERQRHYQTATYEGLLTTLGGNVRTLRESRGWTQERAASECEMSTRLLQRIEAGDCNATLVTLARLCDGFGVSPAVLLAAGS